MSCRIRLRRLHSAGRTCLAERSRLRSKAAASLAMALAAARLHSRSCGCFEPQPSLNSLSPLELRLVARAGRRPGTRVGDEMAQTPTPALLHSRAARSKLQAAASAHDCILHMLVASTASHFISCVRPW